MNKESKLHFSSNFRTLYPAGSVVEEDEKSYPKTIKESLELTIYTRLEVLLLAAEDRIDDRFYTNSAHLG